MQEQFIHIDSYGNKFYNSDKGFDNLHRTDGPAIEYTTGGKEWYINGKRHRSDGPAVEYADGTKIWYLNNKCHREDGPAIDGANGGKFWYINGKLHREDGPAIDYSDGYQFWYINGQNLSEKEFNARMNPEPITLEQIADKFNIPLDKLRIKD